MNELALSLFHAQSERVDQLKKMVDSKVKCIWVHGDPGVGKSIIVDRVVQTLMKYTSIYVDAVQFLGSSDRSIFGFLSRKVLNKCKRPKSCSLSSLYTALETKKDIKFILIVENADRLSLSALSVLSDLHNSIDYPLSI
ncbi:hypothetical protein ACOME3_010327 [Neoechinorhynchus agilis]